MRAYYLVFCLAFLVSLVYEVKNDKQWKWKLFLTFVPLFVYGAIRVDFGNDYATYEDIFEQIKMSESFVLDFNAHEEVGFQLLNRILPSYRSLLVLNAFLLSLALAVFCYHNVPQNYLWLAIILIFLNPEKNIFGSLVGIRNGLVVSLFLLSFSLIQKRKWIPFFFITAVLSTIHTSVLFFLPIAYLVGRNAQFNKSGIIFWIGGSFLLLVASMTQLFNIINALISNEIFNRYEEVLESVSSYRGGVLVVSCLANIGILLLYFRQYGASLSQKENSLLRLGLLFSMSLLLGSLSMRASYFYDMFYIGSVVKIVSDKKASAPLRYGLLLLALVSSYYSMFVVWMGSPYWDHSVYHSLLGNW